MEAENITIKKKSQTKDILRRFFKNKAAVFGLIVILLLILCALFPQVIAPYSYDKQNLKEHFLPPSAAHLFGRAAMRHRNRDGNGMKRKLYMCFRNRLWEIRP